MRYTSDFLKNISIAIKFVHIIKEESDNFLLYIWEKNKDNNLAAIALHKIPG